VRERLGKSAFFVERDSGTGGRVERGGTERSVSEVVGGRVTEFGGHLAEVVVEEDAGEGTAGDEVN
jgi:hypothetical protein